MNGKGCDANITLHMTGTLKGKGKIWDQSIENSLAMLALNGMGMQTSGTSGVGMSLDDLTAADPGLGSIS